MPSQCILLHAGCFQKRALSQIGGKFFPPTLLWRPCGPQFPTPKWGDTPYTRPKLPDMCESFLWGFPPMSPPDAPGLSPPKLGGNPQKERGLKTVPHPLGFHKAPIDPKFPPGPKPVGARFRFPPDSPDLYPPMPTFLNAPFCSLAPRRAPILWRRKGLQNLTPLSTQGRRLSPNVWQPEGSPPSPFRPNPGELTALKKPRSPKSP